MQRYMRMILNNRLVTMNAHNPRYALSSLFGDVTREGADEWLYIRCKAIIYHNDVPVHPLTPSADLAQISERYAPHITTYMQKHKIMKIDGSTCSLLPLSDAEAIRHHCRPHAESFLDRTIRNLKDHHYRILLPVTDPHDHLLALQQINRRFHFRNHPLSLQKIDGKYHIAFMPSQFERLVGQWKQDHICPHRDDFITYVTRPVHKGLSALGITPVPKEPEKRLAEIKLFPPPEARPARTVHPEERTWEGKVLSFPGPAKS